MSEGKELDSVLENEDLNKWEVDIKPLLDILFNTLIGNIEDSKGVWARAEQMSRLMNEKGASVFVEQIRIRVHPQLHNSDLNEQKILDISTEAAMVYADLIIHNFKNWEIEGGTPQYQNICLMLVDNLEICLRIAKDGGFKRHKERRGIKQYLPPVHQEGMV